MTVVLTVSAILFGVLSYFQLPVNDLPAVDYPVIQVSVGYPGASPETVAATIATPLERQFMQIPGLELITSKSTQGYCSLTVQFALTKGLDSAATDVQAAISRASGNLPQDLPAPPTFTKTNPNDQPIMYVALTSDSMTQGQIYDLANTQVGQKISIVSGVSQVAIYGTKSAIRVKADPSALAARGLTVDDLATAIKNGTSFQGAGQFDGPNRTFLLQPQGQLDTADAYNKLIISTKNNSPIYLRDVATATDTVEDERVSMRFWVRGKEVPKATVVIAVFRQAGTNAVQVSKAVRDLVPEIMPTLPASVSVVPVYDRSASIVDNVIDVQETLLIAFILVVLVIFVFLGRATDTLIPVVALPLSLLLTFIAMNLLGYSIDNLSLMALTLAIGFLVDDAIVFLENTVRRMEHYSEPPLKAAINSAKEISFTIISMTLSLSAVFLPLVFMSGLVGRIFREFAMTIVISIFASGIVSLTLTPLMCARMLGPRGKGTKKTWIERVIGAVERRVLGVYGRSLWFFLRHRWVSAVVWVICLVGTVVLFLHVPKSFLPIGDSSFVRGVLIAQEGTSPEKMQQMQRQAEDQLHKVGAVKMTFTASGLSRFLNSNYAFMLAFLDDPGKRPPLQVFTPEGPKTVKDPDINQVTDALKGNIFMNMEGAIPGLQPNPVLQISTGASATQTGQFSYSLSGINPGEVYAAYGAMMAKLSPKQGTIFAPPIISDFSQNTPQLKINIDRDKASSYGVSVTKIEDLLRHAYSQNFIYLIKKPQDQYQLILETKDTDRAQPQDLARLYVQSDDGKNLVPLRAIAQWEQALGPQTVNHINQFTSVTINFNLVPGVPIGEATDYIEQVAKEVVPPQIRGQFQGEALTFRETISSLTILMVLAVFVMYVILAVLYESYLHPITVLSTLPTAMVGGLLTLYLFGEQASLYAFIGLFMLMGIVKKNGIMIVDFAIQRVATGKSAEESIHEASVDRFRPILMTTLAAVMGAVPIALGWGADGASRRPLGLVIVGGLIVSQFITLYVTPVIYLYLEVFQEKVLNRIPFFAAHYEGHTQAGELESSEDDENIPVADIVRMGNGNGHR